MNPGMDDPGFPGVHTTTTTTTRIQTNLRFDPSYVRTIPAILKILQMFFNILGYICVSVSSFSSYSRANWFGFVAMTGFWVTGIALVMYLMHVIEKLHMVPWILAEFVYTSLWTFFYLTAASACAAWGGWDDAFAAAAFFGYCAMLAYGADAFFKFKGWRGGEIAQGDRTMEVHQDIQSPGAY